MSYTDKLTALSNSIKAKNPDYTGLLSLAKMKEAVDNISSGVDTSVITATAADVLSTKKIILSNGTVVNGSIASNGAVSKTLTTSSTSYTVPAGCHNGSGKVSISAQTKSVTPGTSAKTVTADSGKVLTGVTVGAKSGYDVYTGTVTGNGSNSISISTGCSSLKINQSSVFVLMQYSSSNYLNCIIGVCNYKCNPTYNSSSTSYTHSNTFGSTLIVHFVCSEWDEFAEEEYSFDYDINATYSISGSVLTIHADSSVYGSFTSSVTYKWILIV